MQLEEPTAEVYYGKRGPRRQRDALNLGFLARKGTAGGGLNCAGSHAVILDQLDRIARLSERILDADELDRDRTMLGEYLGDARAHAGVLLMLLDRHDRTARLRGVEDRRFVHRLDGVIVDDAALDAVAREAVGRDQRVID